LAQSGRSQNQPSAEVSMCRLSERHLTKQKLRPESGRGAAGRHRPASPLASSKHSAASLRYSEAFDTENHPPPNPADNPWVRRLFPRRLGWRSSSPAVQRLAGLIAWFDRTEAADKTGTPSVARCLPRPRRHSRAPFGNDDEGPQQLLVRNQRREDPLNPPASIRSAALIHFCCRL